MINYVSKMKASIFLVCVLFLETSCTTEDLVEDVEMDDVCGVADPVNSLKWLNEEFKQFLGGPEINGIVLYTYKDQNIIEVQNSLFNSRNIHQHYCNGAKLNLEDPKAFEDYRKNRVEVKILYGTKMWQ
jgi:hypothetical protein